MSLVPIASLGEKLKVPTPTIKAIIQLASTLTGCDYWRTGRTVDRLGLAELSLREIRQLVVDGETAATGLCQRVDRERPLLERKTCRPLRISRFWQQTGPVGQSITTRCQTRTFSVDPGTRRAVSPRSD